MDRDDTSIADFIGGAQLGIASGLVLMAAGVADAVHSAQAEEGAAHLHSGSLACLCPLVFHVPVAVVWVFGDPWVPWIVLVALFANVVADIVLQAMGTKRITAFVESGGFEERMGAAAKRTTEPSVGNGELG